ncbi:hypothetical protein Ade02nite_52050 [Paractinoplanes deccanensis]|uniref:Uncharacterized protein n=1 Tax=Paractinoplanes deccanensis TaxID=113561 RepID=A0ABQ3Y996_9ACTN|nr:hypothetical protein [Actinoplanes deccanensis]GID76564.1 hypothetical protein Ade02nite_52050 [Actinoplanes deccanensis]
MIIAKAVFEVEPWDGPAVPWAARADPWSWVALDAACTDGQIGLFLAVLASRFDVSPQDGPARIADALVAEEMLLVNGGLRVADTATGSVVVPGCCAGLESWHEWADLAAGRAVWLGHDPEPTVEAIGDDLRIWQNRGSGDHVDIPRAVLPSLLLGVRRDLVGFLGALALWGVRAGLGERTAALVEAVGAMLLPVDVRDSLTSSGRA